MAKRLTDISIRNLKPGPVRREISDRANGLFLISQPSGAKSWAVRYRFNGKPVKLTVGVWPAVSLHDARVAAAKAREQVAKGNDPTKARADAKVKADAAKADTLTAVCENYLRREGSKLRTLDQRMSILKRQVYPVLGSRPIGEIKRSEMVHLLDRIEDHNGPRAADVALAILRRIFHWHEKRSDEFRSPIIRGMARQNAAEHRRTRILDDRELRAVWQAASADIAGPFGAFVKLALLTSARRGEIAGMRWDEIDADGIWTLPAARSKTKTEITRPLSKAALAVLDGVPRIDGCPFALSATGRTPISQFSTPKKKLDAASGTSGWRLHDLRRCARSLMSRAHVDSDIAEQILGHSRGDLIERYDRHLPLDRMRDAVERLSALIETIANPPEGAVVPMRRR
jgi:integrase